MKCDDAGHYVFDRVFPGKVGVQHYIQLGPQTWGGPEQIDRRRSGQEQTGEPRRTGRPVVGRVNFPASMPERWVVQQTSIMTKIAFEKPPLPENFESLPMEERKEAYKVAGK